jgi:alpha-1,3-fucosyltransferase
MSVDVFGKQGNSKCPASDCREYIGREYKFFLLFENTVCRDYITEKFFDTIKFDVVPVVLGGGDYSYYLPKSGFVNALDFEGPAELAQYLVQLSSDKAAYNRYFEWKKYIGHDRNHPVQAFLCEMCIKLLLEGVTGVVEPRSLGNLRSRFGMAENCRGQTSDFKYINGSNLKQSSVSSPE